MLVPSKPYCSHGAAKPAPPLHSDDRQARPEIVPAGTISTREQTLVEELKSCWSGYTLRLAEDRKKVGETLTQLQAELVKRGRGGKFASYLRKIGIPKRTAYNLIQEHKNKDKQPEAKAKRKVYTTTQHSEERCRILRSQVLAYFVSLKKKPDFRAKLETFFCEVVKDLLPGAIVEVREQ